jgi:uncharacterized protein (DUF1778 family)
MSEKHRIKTKQFLLRLNDDTYEILKAKATAAKMNKTSFLAELIVTGYVTVLEQSGVKELSDEINKIGVNINQVVHHINARGGGVTEEELRELQEKLFEIEEMIYSIAWGNRGS